MFKLEGTLIYQVPGLVSTLCMNYALCLDLHFKKPYWEIDDFYIGNKKKFDSYSIL